VEVLVRACKGLAWWMRGVLGEDAYVRYLEHHRRSGHAERPMTEREFWRARSDRQETDLRGRCC
jgi:uncharacterized short protein YbdD (DUF466 family)